MPDEYQHFGEALRHYRETYQQRIRKSNPNMPRIHITALALIDCMRQHNYSISSGAYSEIESGISTPKDPRAFLEAVSKCLAIDEGSDEWRVLVQQLGFDILAKKMGEEYARFFFREMSRAQSAGAGSDAADDSDDDAQERHAAVPKR